MRGKIVKWIDSPNGGYGFILGDDGNRYFCHWTQIFFTPHERDRVRFDILVTERGYEAINVEREVSDVR